MKFVRKDSIEPQQERSRQMLGKLLAATIAVLDREGLEGATIPAIAKCADVAAASVYRRFADKDALIRAALEKVLISSANALQDSLYVERFVGKPINKSIATLIASIYSQYKEHPRLIAAINRFSERPEEKKFERLATEVFSGNLQLMVDALSRCTGLENVRGKEAKIQFALMTIVSAIEVKMSETTSLWNELVDDTDEQLQKKWATMFMAYVQL